MVLLFQSDWKSPTDEGGTKNHKGTKDGTKETKQKTQFLKQINQNKKKQIVATIIMVKIAQSIQMTPAKQESMYADKYTISYLLTNEAETSILSNALEGLPQHRVKGLIAASECCSGVTGNGKGSNVNLNQMKCTFI